MKNYMPLLCVIFLMFSCVESVQHRDVYVSDTSQLNAAIIDAIPGDEIILNDGVWTDAQINFYGNGVANKPITLRAENPGKVLLEGQSYIHLGGNHLIVEGLTFKNGYSPNNSIIRFKIGEDTTAFNSRVTNCVIKNFTKPSRLTNDHWVEFYGKYNKIDHCYITGKSNDGETLRVFQDGNKNTSNYHQIVNNYFGPRPRKGGPRAETIRIGDSKTSMSSGFVNVSNNYFEACNGEVEVISDKTNFNQFKNNIFYKCEGSLVLRHGSFSKVDGNIFIGDDDSDFYGGIRVVSTGHFITNNYFYKIRGSKFRSPLAMMNGIPMSPLNRYKQVTDVVVAHNTWVDCKSPIQIGVGQNIESSDVLPKSEIRSAPPIRSIIANNIIYNHQVDQTPVVNHDRMDDILFTNNLIDNKGEGISVFNVVQNQGIKMKQVNPWLYIPEELQLNGFSEVYKGYGFESIETDLFGGSRLVKNNVGAILTTTELEGFEIDKKKYGPTWYVPEKNLKPGNILNVSSRESELADKISGAKDGDTLVLIDKAYSISSSLKINKDITIQSKDSKNKAQLVFKGNAETPAFEMHPYGALKLENVDMASETNQVAFSPLKKNMCAAYNLQVNNCIIEDFESVLKAYKGSFADSILVKNTKIENCKRGIILAAEEKGDYNAEVLIIDNSEFVNVREDVLNYYRGGYDESTIGGSLVILNSIFNSCGTTEKSGVLLKTRGIVNVNFSGNTFQNNPVKLVALLWGEKNNSHKNNVLIHSGEIKVENQLKLDILY